VSSLTYDSVFDSQKHYRVLLNSTARPGTIGLLDDVCPDTPPSLSHAAALVTLALFSSDVSFHSQLGNMAAEFVQRQTQARAVSAPEAEFLLLNGDTSAAIEAIKTAKMGSLEFPETGATVILQVASVSPAPFRNCLKLILTGPGIETTAIVYVAGMSSTLLELIESRNREFPLGIDAILVCDSLSTGPCVLSLPRTTKVHWEPVSWDM
jgi:alpha-D-ribose 1-methylphosphonate 5-triphosphate synthase subunit PhnH